MHPVEGNSLKAARMSIHLCILIPGILVLLIFPVLYPEPCLGLVYWCLVLIWCWSLRVCSDSGQNPFSSSSLVFFFSFSFWDIQRLSSRNTQGCICLFLRSMKSIKVYLVCHCWCHCWCHFQKCFHTGLPLFETERRQQNLFTAWCPVGCGFSSLYSWEVFLKWMSCVLFFSIGEIWMTFCTC